mmetsp:Transcript_2643/g.10229  ORF Transcript_2643/g.10229 Transcript_2643/m.10229 type:complete len:204 (+) Transcript_2643:1918-2529(+)
MLPSASHPGSGKPRARRLFCPSEQPTLSKVTCRSSGWPHRMRLRMMEATVVFRSMPESPRPTPQMQSKRASSRLERWLRCRRPVLQAGLFRERSCAFLRRPRRTLPACASKARMASDSTGCGATHWGSWPSDVACWIRDYDALGFGDMAPAFACGPRQSWRASPQGATRGRSTTSCSATMRRLLGVTNKTKSRIGTRTFLARN